MLPQSSLNRATPPRATVSFRAVGLAALLVATSSLALAQNTDNRGGGRRTDGGGGGGNGGDRGNFNPADMMARLRERFGVTNDDEWAVISERITAVNDLRRSMAGGMAMMFGRGGPGGDRGSSNGGDRGGRTSRTSGGTEIAALNAAVTDKLPDAEIKARLDRVRELRKENEAKLAKAQEDLRAVLSVRQEAVAVLLGMLP